MSEVSEPATARGRPVIGSVGDAVNADVLRVSGTIEGTRTVPVGRGVAYRATLSDGTGRVDLMFLGRAAVIGMDVGVRCAVEGRVAVRHGRLVVWNPRYRLLAPDEGVQSGTRPETVVGKRPASTDATASVEATGRFRVYLGAAAGVGKTCAMLNEARRRRRRGTDVVIGFVEAHGRPMTAAAMEGLEVVPRKTVEYRGVQFEELDVEAVLARQPGVVLVDELAHTNVPGSGRNAKRWQDVRDILDAGIGVITTLNIQHLESLARAAEAITGSPVRERVPDEVVRRADQIELVDSSPEQLRRRMLHGNIYPPEQVPQALNNFFRADRLAALRELALRFLADETAEEAGGAGASEAAERIVAAVTASADSAALLRQAARLSGRLRCRLTVVHVTPVGLESGRYREQVAALRAMSRELHAEWVDLPADDEARAIVRFARDNQITQIVVGPGRRGRWSQLLRGSAISKIISVAAVAGLDVHLLGFPPGEQ